MKTHLQPEYRVILHEFSAADYGVPQNRKRIMFIGLREDVIGEFLVPPPTHSREALLYSQYVSHIYWERHGLRSKFLAKNDPLEDRINTDAFLTVVDSTKPHITIRDALERWFSVRGFEADVAQDGAEGVKKAGAARYDAVVMDLEMPEMGGVEATREIKALDPELPIVAVSGFSESVAEVLEAGASKFPSKPLRLAELEAEVRLVMRDSPES